MRKKFTSFCIALIIVTVILTIFSSWAKIMDKSYADDALSVCVALYFATGLVTLIWYLYFYEKKVIKF